MDIKSLWIKRVYIAMIKYTQILFLTIFSDKIYIFVSCCKDYARAILKLISWSYQWKLWAQERRTLKKSLFFNKTKLNLWETDISDKIKIWQKYLSDLLEDQFRLIGMTT